jgi:hypothetical protein
MIKNEYLNPRVPLYTTRIAGSSSIKNLENGATNKRTEFFGSKGTLGKAKQCFSVELSKILRTIASYKRSLSISSVKAQIPDLIQPPLLSGA